MHTDSNVLSAVINKFPEKAKILALLFQKHEYFREVCEDYYLCKEAIDKIIISNAQKKKVLNEYKNALKELELELLLYLNSETTKNDN
jgi:hypothetical protein